MATPLGILDLLKLRGYDSSKPAKFVRHQDSRVDVHDLLRRGCLEAYQARQGRPIFDGCEYIVSFVGFGGTKAKLIGVYQVGPRHEDAIDRPLPSGFPEMEWTAGPYFYELSQERGYEDLENRVVIDWGKGAIQWAQWASNKEVIEILPAGQLLAPFQDYLDFTLTHADLTYLCRNEDANREWRSRLAAVAGVYLILATTTGEQYVGSAYGTEGIWGRWSEYAKNGHGGNVLLRGLLDADPAYPEAFSYSILQILPKTFAGEEVRKREQLYKKKLGSRAKGLNAN